MIDFPAPARDSLAELLPPLTENEALLESNRCLYCYDAPCTHACPTHIDVPRFIKKIATGNLIGSAATILESNLLGATCARVCPVQELCEGACVLQAEHRPIAIGRLQRYAMDHIADRGTSPRNPKAKTGKLVAVIGAGAAGLSCAGELALAGHSVTIFERRPLPGGLSTYGIITLREPIEVALAEVQMIQRLGVKLETEVEFGVHISLPQLQATYHAVFLGVGLGTTPDLAIEGDEHIQDGLKYIESSKVGGGKFAVGRRVIVIGIGNTAIDCATIAKRRGADAVTMVYRRSEAEISAYEHEYEFIKNEGVSFQFLAQPTRVPVDVKGVTGLECVRIELGDLDSTGRPTPQPKPGSEFMIPADQIVKAIGQERPPIAALLGLETHNGYIKVSFDFETSIAGVFAGGDCVRSRGAASTVMAVQDGKMAARAIDRKLTDVKD